MKNGDAVRVRDIARIANVSTATVSRALSRPDLVSERTREAVLKAVAETGYTINIAARNLRRQRTGSVLALVPNLANPFFSSIIGGINSVLRGRGLTLLVADTQGSTVEVLTALANRSRADGLIVLDGGIPASVLSHGACPPVVQACEWVDGLAAPRVVADNRGGAAMAIRHLRERGHHRIAELAGPSLNMLTRERTAGVRSEVEVRPEWRLSGDFTIASGQQAGRDILAMRDRPDAIFCHNDEMACGLMGELQRGGMRVPDDIAVMGFDDIGLSEHVTPGLTTIRQQRSDLGTAAARMLLDLMDGHMRTDETVMPVQVVPRGSTAPR